MSLPPGSQLALSPPSQREGVLKGEGEGLRGTVGTMWRERFPPLGGGGGPFPGGCRLKTGALGPRNYYR